MSRNACIVDSIYRFILNAKFVINAFVINAMSDQSPLIKHFCTEQIDLSSDPKNKKRSSFPKKVRSSISFQAPGEEHEGMPDTSHTPPLKHI